VIVQWDGHMCSNLETRLGARARRLVIQDRFCRICNLGV
jgi:hypothetical protein